MAMPFRPVDVSGQAKMYRLERRGAEDGSTNRPETASNLPMLAEQEILAAIHAERDRCLIDLTAHLRAERDALAQLQTAMDIAGMRQEADTALSDFTAIKSGNASNLEHLGQAVVAAVAEHECFRTRNRLVRAARQPTGRTSFVVMVAFLIVVEGLVNAIFFASGSDLGLLGGIVLAVAFSAVNVGVGALNGWFPLRWAHHQNIAIKLSGLVAFPALCVASVALNGFVAHYRDTAQSQPEADPLATAYAGLIGHPFGLQSIESWLLFALGLGCAGYAVAKGFALDDPHPGYGAHDRRRLNAQKAHDDARQDVRDRACNVRDQFTGELRETIESLRGSSSQRQQLLASRARNLFEFEAHEAHLEQAAQQLLSVYRRANEAVRQTPPPARFGRAFAFPERAIDRPAIRSLLEDQGLEVDAERLIKELDDLRHQVLARYETLLGGPTAGVAA